VKILLVAALLVPVPAPEPIRVAQKTISNDAVVLVPGGPSLFRVHVETDVAVTEIPTSGRARRPSR
jgi:hypothetical protein